MILEFTFLVLTLQRCVADFGSVTVDDTTYATKHDEQISLEEFFDNNHLYLPRPDISNQLFIELNIQGIHEKNITNKMFYKKVSQHLRRANPMVNVLKLNGGYSVCFKDGSFEEIKREYKRLRKTLYYVIKSLNHVDISVESIVFSLNLMNAKISDNELDQIREATLNRGSHKDLINMQIQGVRIIFIDEIIKQTECEATSRWPQRTRKPPEIIDNLLK